MAIRPPKTTNEEARNDLVAHLTTQGIVQSGDKMKQTRISADARETSVIAILSKKEEDFGRILESVGMSAERFIRVVATQVRANQKLFEAAMNDKISLISCCMEMAALGLDPSVPNEASLIPRKGSVTLNIDYKGLRKLAERSAREAGNPMRVLQAFPIHENDRYERGFDGVPYFRHAAPDFGTDRGPVVGYAAVAMDGNGNLVFDEMTVKQVQTHQADHSEGAKYATSPFYNGKNFDSYALKTLIRRLCWRHLSMGPLWGRVEQNLISAESEPSEPAKKPTLKIPHEQTEAPDLSTTGPTVEYDDDLTILDIQEQQEQDEYNRAGEATSPTD